MIPGFNIDAAFWLEFGAATRRVGTDVVADDDVGRHNGRDALIGGTEDGDAVPIGVVPVVVLDGIINVVVINVERPTIGLIARGGVIDFVVLQGASGAGPLPYANYTRCS